MINRLLINMQNKIETINGAIDMIYRLQKGETITVGDSSPALTTVSVSMKENSTFDYNKRLIELFEERENLQVRVNRML